MNCKAKPMCLKILITARLINLEKKAALKSWNVRYKTCDNTMWWRKKHFYLFSSEQYDRLKFNDRSYFHDKSQPNCKSRKWARLPNAACFHLFFTQTTRSICNIWGQWINIFSRGNEAGANLQWKHRLTSNEISRELVPTNNRFLLRLIIAGSHLRITSLVDGVY